MMAKAVSLFTKNKKNAFALGVALMVMMIATSAGASPTADAATVSSVTDGMGGIQKTALAVVAAIAGIAVTLFAAPFAWQYGKKIFKTVSR